MDVSISGGQKWACCQSLANRQKLLATRILLRVARNGCLYFWWPEMGMLLISGHQKSNYGHHNSTWVEQEWMLVFLVARNVHVANFWSPEIKFWPPELYLGWPAIDVCISGCQKSACGWFLATGNKFLATRNLYLVVEMSLWVISGQKKSIHPFLVGPCFSYRGSGGVGGGPLMCLAMRSCCRGAFYPEF